MKADLLERPTEGPWGRDIELDTDGAGARIGGNSNDDDGDGEDHCLREEWLTRHNVKEIQDTKDAGTDGDPTRVFSHECGVAGCKLAIICHPTHGVFQEHDCIQRPQ